MKRISIPLLAALFVGAGRREVQQPGAYVAIMPPYLPWHRELVWVSGAAEIAGGLGLLNPRTRRAAGIGMVLLLLAVWPANWQMAVDAAGAPGWRALLLWLRVPLQIPLMLWIWRSSRGRPLREADRPETQGGAPR
jgi:uncharacterized membrane protein